MPDPPRDWGIVENTGMVMLSTRQFVQRYRIPAPALNIVAATASTFRAEDLGDPRFYIFATLVSGVLRFEVVAQLATGERGSVSGKQFFAAMMAHFGAKVKIIEGNWNRASGLNTNLDQWNHATAAGMSVHKAASLTWTGLRASEWGYDKVMVTRIAPLNAQGNYDTVRVEFSR